VLSALVASLFSLVAGAPAARAANVLTVPPPCYGHSVGPGGTYTTPEAHRQASLYLLNTYNCSPATSDSGNNFIAASGAANFFTSGNQYAYQVTFTQTSRALIQRHGCIVDGSDPASCTGDSVFTGTVLVETVIDWPAPMTAATLSPKLADGSRHPITQQPGGAWAYDDTLSVTLTRSGTCGMETRYLGGVPATSCTYNVSWGASKPNVETLAAFTFLAHTGYAQVDPTHWLIVCDVTGTICTAPDDDLVGVGEAAAVARLVRGPVTSTPTASFTSTPITSHPGQYQFDSTSNGRSATGAPRRDRRSRTRSPSRAPTR
jgi:hypothetical protein